MPSPPTLISFEQVKRQLRITHDESDLEIYETLVDAEDIVLRYLNGGDDDTWTTETVPGAVRAAILRQAVHLWRLRGDQDVPDRDDDGLAPGVKRLLVPYRTQTLA